MPISDETAKRKAERDKKVLAVLRPKSKPKRKRKSRAKKKA